MLPLLLDIELADSTRHYWATHAGTYPVALGAGPTAAYLPWVLAAGPFRQSKSMRADAGELVVQNLSGNTIGRDVAAALKAKEFEGALCVARSWNVRSAAAEFEFHGYLLNPRADAAEVRFRLRQLFDPNQYDVPDLAVSEHCTWRYKSKQCGSTSSEAACDFTFAACVVRAATERFNGVINPPPQTQFAQPIATRGGGGAGGGGGGGGDDGMERVAPTF